jgi:hypothetical protein
MAAFIRLRQKACRLNGDKRGSAKDLFEVVDRLALSREQKQPAVKKGLRVNA